MPDVKRCSWSACLKPLEQNPQETSQQYKKRTHCDRSCANAHRAEKSKAARKKAGKKVSAWKQNLQILPSAAPVERKETPTLMELYRQRMLQGALR